MRKYPVIILAVLGLLTDIVTQIAGVGHPLTTSTIITIVITAIQHTKVYSPATVSNLLVPPATSGE